MLKIQFVNR